MDLLQGCFAVIGTLVAVVPVLWLSLRGVEKRFGRKLADAETACREELAGERALREKDHAAIRQLEGDVRALLVNEMAKGTQALAFVGGKLGLLIDRVDDVAERVGLPPRSRDPENATTVQLQALTGGPR